MELELSEADFDAYAPERTRATTMTAPRVALKRKLEAWMHAVAERLRSEGIAWNVSSTDEHPSARNGHRVELQSAFLFRADEARRAMRSVLGANAPREEPERPELGQARLEVRVDANAASLLVWLGGDAHADLEHAHAMLSQDTEEMFAAWEALPDDSGVEARAALSPRARRVVDLAPRDASAMAKQAIESEVPLVIGVRITRDDATQAHALASWDSAADAFARFLHLVAWSPEGAAFVAARMSERPSKRGKRRDVPRAAPSAPIPEERPSSATMKVAIDRGAHVRALAGPFAGQAGVVQELDGKGGARVLFGLLNARVELRDLVIKGKDRGRPVMGSSHRKPSS